MIDFTENKSDESQQKSGISFAIHACVSLTSFQGNREIEMKTGGIKSRFLRVRKLQ